MFNLSDEIESYDANSNVNKIRLNDEEEDNSDAHYEDILG